MICATAFQQEILKRLSELSQVYIVGGAIRDAQLGIPIKDVDAVTALPLREIEKRLSAWGYVPHIIGTRLQTVSLFKGEERLDIAPFLGNVETDSGRRDFTINAIYQDVRTGKMNDPLGGLQDLKEGRLKACGRADDRFREDPLRILRLVRFSVCYGLKIDQGTRKSAADNITLLKRVPAERTTQELARILVLEDINRALMLLDDLGYWQEYIPELARLKGLVQNIYHKKDAWEHTLHVVRNTPNQILLRLAALFHDLGKWDTASRECRLWGIMTLSSSGYRVGEFKLVNTKSPEQWKDKAVEIHGGKLDNHPDVIVVKRITAALDSSKKHLEIVPEGKRHFLQHEQASVRLVKNILPRFRWSMVLPGGKKGERELEYLVGHHMVGTLTFNKELKEEVKLTKVVNKTCRFAWEIGWDGQVYNQKKVDNFLDLWKADFLGGKQVEEENIERFIRIQEYIREAGAFLAERDKRLNWSIFSQFAHEKGIVGERFGWFKEWVRPKVMLNKELNLNDIGFLKREYTSFLRNEINPGSK